MSNQNRSFPKSSPIAQILGALLGGMPLGSPFESATTSKGYNEALDRYTKKHLPEWQMTENLSEDDRVYVTAYVVNHLYHRVIQDIGKYPDELGWQEVLDIVVERKGIDLDTADWGEVADKANDVWTGLEKDWIDSFGVKLFELGLCSPRDCEDAAKSLRTVWGKIFKHKCSNPTTCAANIVRDKVLSADAKPPGAKEHAHKCDCGHEHPHQEQPVEEAVRGAD